MADTSMIVSSKAKSGPVLDVCKHPRLFLQANDILEKLLEHSRLVWSLGAIASQDDVVCPA